MTNTKTAAREYAEKLFPIKDFANFYNWNMCCTEHEKSFTAGAEHERAKLPDLPRRAFKLYDTTERFESGVTDPSGVKEYLIDRKYSFDEIVLMICQPEKLKGAEEQE